MSPIPFARPILVLLAVGWAGAAWAGDTVRIDAGSLQGVSVDGITSFKGVPYAQPPVGPLRWRAPLPAVAWTGIRPADKQGAICMQKLSKDNGVGPGPASEDCLTLNVFTPSAAKSARLPVMVWIHGGGLVNGSGTAALYDGSALAKQGVVVVSINYRLGRFGFFAHPALTAEAKGGATANYGLMDQVAALQWVKRNIAAFGGDPGEVTIFGESAGGVSVNRMMMIPAAKGLFKRAIVQSGAGAERGEGLAEAEGEGAAFAAQMGAGDAAALRALSADAIVAAGDINMLKGSAPILDGMLLTEDASIAFAAGRQAHVPYLIGSNSLEIAPSFGGAFKSADRFDEAQHATLAAAYGSEALMKDRLLTDEVFGAPARSLAKAQAATGAPTYLYRFSVVSASIAKTFSGAIHASDRQYVFQTLNASPWPTDARDAEQAKTISAYWVAFAKTGDPNGGGRPVWPRYGASDQLIDFTNDGPVARKTPDAPVLNAISTAQPPKS